MLQRIQNRLPKDFPQHVLEDLKVRTVMTLGRAQKTDYFGTEENVTKMKNKRYILGLGKTYKEDFPYLCVSFFTRASAMEVCFGDVDDEKANLAHSICQSLLKVSDFTRIDSL